RSRRIAGGHVKPLTAVLAGLCVCYFFFQAEDGIRDWSVTGVQTCALPISLRGAPPHQRQREDEAERRVGRIDLVAHPRILAGNEIGRASCRERVEISAGVGSSTTKRNARGGV